VRAKEKPVPKDGVYIGVDPRELPDLAVFKDIDAPWCPEMVLIPAGQFLMGSPPDEKGRYDFEGPQHRGEIGYRFALGRYAVVFAEYDHFCEVTTSKKPADQGWGRGRRPVINVDWRDAQAYVEWLSHETGQVYRLPSEAEWEYACRAGTTTRYSWGDDISNKNANCGGGWFSKTKEVGSYPANPWGLYDMHGNVFEWMEDMWHDSYSGAPVDGAAWTDGKGTNSDSLASCAGGPGTPTRRT
jgi:formylglycine-generating enzyme required for sulfatase activity